MTLDLTVGGNEFDCENSGHGSGKFWSLVMTRGRSILCL